MEIQANPDIEQLKLALWLAGSLIVIMLSVIGYFIKQQIEASRNIAEALTTLKETVVEIRAQNEFQFPTITTRLNRHKDIIEDHESRLKELETEHKLIHKSCKR